MTVISRRAATRAATILMSIAGAATLLAQSAPGTFFSPSVASSFLPSFEKT